MSRPVQGGLSVAAVVLIPLLAVGGSDSFRAALDFTTGVLSLVSLTASVAWGLIATDRLLLSTRHRLLAQAVHRSTAVASLGFLLLHATVKVSLGHTQLIGALIPFGLGLSGTAGLIGFGSLAGLLMVIAASTGAARSALAGRGSIAARWRPLHMLAYPAWCAALIHGLYAGRPAASWVVTMYCLALAGVAAAVSVRLLPRPVQDRLAARLLALIGPGAAQRDAEPARRDLSVSPLPGAAPAPEPSPSPSPSPFPSPSPSFSPSERPSVRPSERLSDRPFGGRRRAQPSPAFDPPPSRAPLYDPVAAERPAAGAGLSAGYRAVSRGNASAPGAPAAAPDVPGIPGIPDFVPGFSTQEIPLAERIPMTEELPVVPDEPATRPGYWPTPSPPPPAQSPTPPSYPSPAPSSVSYPSSPSPSYNSPTDPAPGPFQYPPAGEPWSAPAGDRP
ncbi:hypothetical protein AB0A69_00530 [Streptomyces sp. NPDC045431]|uniref:hypothetical protein n=1 Tax=Streptomyces sp. NPDC045431 TaxID=3155613 RepID=UPI0033F7B835